MTARQRPQTFRELLTDLYVHGVGFRGLSRLLALLGCGVGAATLWREGNPKVPASTHRWEGWFGHFKPRARLARG